MAVKSKKARKRGLDKQFADIKKLQRRIRAGSLFDIESKDDLLIDDFFNDYGKGDKRFLRSAVEGLARDVLSRITWLYELPSDARGIGGLALKTVAKLDREAEWLRNLDEWAISVLGHAFSPTEEAIEEGYSIKLEWDETINVLRKLHELYDTLRRKYELRAPLQTGRGEILAHRFVLEMRDFHARQFGERAPNSKSGRFVRFMQAAWIDLKFPRLPEDTLGYMAERLPHL